MSLLHISVSSQLFLISLMLTNADIEDKLMKALQRLKYGYINSKKTTSDVQKVYQTTSMPIKVEKSIPSDAFKTRA